MTTTPAGRPAIYRYNKTSEPVTLLKITEDGMAVIVFSDGRLDKVELHRVRLVTL